MSDLTNPNVGLSLKQEPKYTVNGCAIVNRISGEEIPWDEPVFILRARDKHAIGAMIAYGALISKGPEEHRKAVVQRIADFVLFAQMNQERMKEPDTQLSLPLEE